MVDLSVYDKLKTYDDYQRADQQFQLQRALSAQALQAGPIDLATKQNLLKSQILAAGAGSGNQDTYNKSIQSLGQLGIDASDVPADLASGIQYANAAIAAKNPYALFNAQQKVIGNNIAGAGTGSNAFNQPVPTGIIGGGFNQPPAPQVAPTQLAAALPSSPAVAAGNLSTNAAAGINTLYPPNTPTVAPNTNFNQNAGSSPQISPATANLDGSPAAAPLPLSPKAPPPVPVKDPAETNAQYSARFNVWKEDPLVIGSASGAKTLSEDDAKNLSDTKKAYDAAISQLPNVMGNFQAMRESAPDASYGPLAETSQALNTLLGGKTATANTIVSQKAAQNTVKEIGPLLAGAGQKGNLFFDRLATKATSLNDADGPDQKVIAVNGLDDTYTKGLKALAATLRASGQPALSDDQIDAAAKANRVAPKVSQNPASPNAPTIDPASTDAAASYFSAQQAISKGYDKTKIAAKLQAAGLDPKKVGL